MLWYYSQVVRFHKTTKMLNANTVTKYFCFTYCNLKKDQVNNIREIKSLILKYCLFIIKNIYILVVGRYRR